MCVAQNDCLCNPGYSGKDCEFHSCFGVPSNNPNVCNGGGKCVSPDKCVCQGHLEGDNCEKWKPIVIKAELYVEPPYVPQNFILHECKVWADKNENVPINQPTPTDAEKYFL